ncbi:hypothetical protein EYF80_028991 [Liparis tanakae]|uniref:Uncharacterized protein n=1 Tax=Liparis tanakae TaxID=230148 RepID=A0A4Z2H5B5_9TELE|nr:hypothetical protein EYF80_028991 [Liparis tanakae]
MSRSSSLPGFRYATSSPPDRRSARSGRSAAVRSRELEPQGARATPEGFRNVTSWRSSGDRGATGAQGFAHGHFDMLLMRRGPRKREKWDGVEEREREEDE